MMASCNTRCPSLSRSPSPRPTLSTPLYLLSSGADREDRMDDNDDEASSFLSEQYNKGDYYHKSTQSIYVSNNFVM